jgi:nucleoside-triphosphatase THEP1
MIWQDESGCGVGVPQWWYTMNSMVTNIFLTGAPSSGKTTVIKKVIQGLDHPANGFYTEEERTGGKRVGFRMRTLDGRTGYLAHQDIRSEFHIRRYGVSIENIETIAVPSIVPVDRNVIILDEIGKMECFSGAFKQAAVRALDVPNAVIGTITFGGDQFIMNIKNRADMEIIEVTPDNRDGLPAFLLQKVSGILL